jgi:hypothetical protein
MWFRVQLLVELETLAGRCEFEQAARMPLDDGDVLAKALARKQLERTLHRKLFGVTRGHLSSDNHAAHRFFDDQITNPSVGRLPNSRFHLFGE